MQHGKIHRRMDRRGLTHEWASLVYERKAAVACRPPRLRPTVAGRMWQAAELIREGMLSVEDYLRVLGDPIDLDATSEFTPERGHE